MPADAPRRVSLRILTALVVALVALAGLEAALRLAGFEHRTQGPAYRFLNPERAFGERADHPVVVHDPHLFWRLRPGVDLVGGRMRTNSRGFRTPEFDAIKPQGVVRIVVLGDSISFGIEVDESATWPRRLEQRLRGRFPGPAGARIEVVNLGVPGYTSHQGLLLLEEAARWSPDLVVACFGAFNDWVPAVGRVDSAQTASAGLQGLRLYQVAAWLAGREPPDMELRLEHVSGAPNVSAERRLAHIDTRTFEGRRRVPLPEFRSNLEAIGARAAAAGARFALLAAPLPAATVRRNPVALAYADAVRAAAAALGCPLADGWSAFRACGLPDDALFVDFCHPSERGHDLLAEALAASLAPVVAGALERARQER